MTGDLFDYTPPPRYPDAPGFKNRDTSKEAADSMKPSAPRLRQMVLDKLRARGPSTPDEIADALDLSILSIRPRFTELHKTGQIVDTGDRRKNTSGRNAKVWKVT